MKVNVTEQIFLSMWYRFPERMKNWSEEGLLNLFNYLEDSYGDNVCELDVVGLDGDFYEEKDNIINSEDSSDTCEDLVICRYNGLRLCRSY